MLTPDGRLDDLDETAKDHISPMVEHLFHIKKEKYGLKITRHSGGGKNKFKADIMASFMKLYLALGYILCMK